MSVMFFLLAILLLKDLIYQYAVKHQHFFACSLIGAIMCKISSIFSKFTFFVITRLQVLYNLVNLATITCTITQGSLWCSAVMVWYSRV